MHNRTPNPQTADAARRGPDRPCQRTPAARVEELTRDEAIRRIRASLKQRSGRAWSVTGGRGTAYGWITITVPPARRGEFDSMPAEDRALLADLLGLEHVPHHGVQVPASSAYRHEYVARAAGDSPAVYGTPYWD
jgi:hypothetical protein